MATVRVPDRDELAALVGTTFPPGRFHIDPVAHRRAMAALHVDSWSSPLAHPVYGHIALNSGMGIEREEFFALCGATLRTGALFGRGVISFSRPLRIDSDYTIKGRISATERKSGRRAGTFDLVTVALEAVDDEGTSAVAMDETYVFLRQVPDRSDSATGPGRAVESGHATQGDNATRLIEFDPVVVEVSERDVASMMDVMGDVNPVHSDHALVAELGLRGLVNQGPANLAYALNAVLSFEPDPAGIRHVDVRFDAITCPGDRLVATGGVVAVRPGDSGTFAACTFRLDRDLGDGTTEPILAGTAEVATTREL